MATVPLEGPNAGWVYNALESAIDKHGAPKQTISDQASVFTDPMTALSSLDKRNLSFLGDFLKRDWVFLAPAACEKI